MKSEIPSRAEKSMRQTTETFLKNTLLITLGSFIYAFSVKALIVPQDLLAAGLTGFALLIFYQGIGLPLGLINFLINIPVFLLGWRFVGRRFALYSFWGMSIYSLALWLIRVRVPLSDPLLAILVASALSGTGTAIILKSYGSSGGTDILCVIMHKFAGLTLGAGSILLNAILLTLSALVFPLEAILYTAIYIYVAAFFTDRIFHLLTARRSAIIISTRWEEVIKALAEQKIRTTRLQGSGGFQGGERTLLLSVTTARRVSSLKRIVTRIDENAFIAIMVADDVTGLEVGNQPHW